MGAVAFGCGMTLAMDVVYPVGKYNKTTHDNVYFMGSLEKGETLFYQGAKVATSKNGAFAFTVPLRQGRNQVFLRACKDGRCMIKQYYITRTLEAPKTTTDIAFTPISKTVFKTVGDNVPLRYTPVDAGMNRMGHLSKDTQLIIDGRKGDFYRVYLTPSRYGWIMRKDVVLMFDKKGYPVKPELAHFYNVEDKTVPDMALYRVAFSNNLPYEVLDTPTELVINVFNVKGMNDETLVLRVAKNEWVKYNTEFTNGDFILLMKNIVKKQGLPLSGLTIAIDAGHGGNERGALGIFRDNEKDINLAVAQKLQEELKSKGANVVMTRNADIDMDLNERVKLAKAYDSDIFLSIHMNSVPQGADPNKRSGSGVYYYNNSSKKLAETMKDALVSKLNTNDDGIHQESFAVLRATHHLSVLAELCYMVNPEDSDIYKSEKFASRAAEALAKGLVDYVSDSSYKPETAKLITTPTGEKPAKKTKVKKEKTPKVKVEKEPKPKNEKIIKQKPVKETSEKQLRESKPFFDTSVREKYQQEAIYVIDKEDTKWYRPNGKKKRAKRPAREIKTNLQQPQEVNIFASGDYQELYTTPQPSLGQRCRNFLSKLGSYFYNGARN